MNGIFFISKMARLQLWHNKLVSNIKDPCLLYLRMKQLLLNSNFKKSAVARANIILFPRKTAELWENTNLVTNEMGQRRANRAVHWHC
jgi:hypothetical protein